MVSVISFIIERYDLFFYFFLCKVLFMINYKIIRILKLGSSSWDDEKVN